MGVTDSVLGFEDTFFGPQDKKYMDRLARDMIKIRGIKVLYFKKLDVPARIDGLTPLSNNPTRGDFDPKGRSGSEMAALYGDSVVIGNLVNPTTRPITPAWDYADPIELRGVAFNPQQNDVPDERGHIKTFKLTLNLARAMCDDVQLVPQIGDIVQVPKLLDDYFDVELLKRDSHRFGGTGFFTAYELSLSRTTKFVPERKNIPGVPTTGAFVDTTQEVKNQQQGKPAKGSFQQ